MASDGLLLKTFVERSRIRPVRIYQNMDISKQAFYALYKSKEFEADTIKKIEKAVGTKWEEIKKVNIDGNILADTKQANESPEPNVGQPIMQAIINMTYQGRKNSDSIDKLAATNQRNSDLIAAMFCELFPNSKFAEKLAASLNAQSEGDDFPIEDELSEEGIDLLRKQSQTGKKKVGGK